MIVIGLGANLPSQFGASVDTLCAAKKAMGKAGLSIAKESRMWLTAPVPLSGQPWYHNEIVSVETLLSAFQVLDLLQDIEEDFGRVRTIRNAPRVLDLDLIAYHDDIINKPELIVPHPRMHKRAFVLFPMQDIVENWEHPLLRMTLHDLILNLSGDQMAMPMAQDSFSVAI